MLSMAVDDVYPFPWPSLRSWASVDPTRHPFDPAGARAVVRSIAAGMPPPAPVDLRVAWEVLVPARKEASRWNMAMTRALVEHYGDWAFGWHWSEGTRDYVGRLPPRYDYWEAISSPETETLTLLADELVEWRRCLERLAGRFDRLRPALCPDGLPDAVAWEAAITHVVLTSVGHREDYDQAQGWCGRVLIWFLNAAGLPDERSAELVDGSMARWYHGWARMGAADVADVAERLAREVTGAPRAGLARTGEGADDWPDTWPHGWPSWRATNFARDHS